MSISKKKLLSTIVYDAIRPKLAVIGARASDRQVNFITSLVIIQVRKTIRAMKGW